MKLLIKESDSENPEVTKLKDKLYDLSERIFYLKMTEHWTHDEYKLYDELHKELQDTIEDLKKLGINAHYDSLKGITYEDINN